MSIKVKVTEILLEYDEPYISLAETEDHKPYLCLAIEHEDYTNPHLCVALHEEHVDRLKFNEIDLKSVIIHPARQSWYIGDLSTEEFRLKLIAKHIWDVPHSYIPGDGLFLYEDHARTEFDRNELQVAIDGNWSTSEFSGLSNTYDHIYALIYTLATSPASSLQREVVAHPYRDGFSSMHMHRRLFKAIPRPMRPRVKSIQYASPGHIEFVGHPAANSFFCNSIEIIRDNYNDLSRRYSNALEAIKELGLRGTDVRDFSPAQSPEAARILDNHFLRLIEILNLRSVFQRKLDNANKLGRVKIVLYLIRRMREMSELVYGEKLKLD